MLSEICKNSLYWSWNYLEKDVHLCHSEQEYERIESFVVYRAQPLCWTTFSSYSGFLCWGVNMIPFTVNYANLDCYASSKRWKVGGPDYVGAYKKKESPCARWNQTRISSHFCVMLRLTKYSKLNMFRDCFSPRFYTIYEKMLIKILRVSKLILMKFFVSFK